MKQALKYLSTGAGKTILSSLCLSFLIIALPCSVTAQDSITRPKLGLALSGGGSHGLAHIGVLKVMEEAGLRPDFITGVSMGAIIGSLYSVGYSPDTLQILFNETDLGLALSDRIPENLIIYHEKKHFHNSILALPITPNKLILPPGLIQGQQVENFLSYFLWPAADCNDFNQLPVPFCCLSTNILTGEIVRFNSGYLPDAVRASIGIPSVFAPFKIDSMLLVDGGVARNIAVSELKAMGADIVIGSYTGFKRYDEAGLESLDGIIKQVGFYSSLRDYDEQKKLVDFLIEPDVKGFPSITFYNVDTLINRGYRAALPFREQFRKLADSLNRFGRQAPVKKIIDRQYYIIDRIEVTGNTVHSDAQILGVLDISPGKEIDRDMLGEKMELLYGNVWFEQVRYRFEPRNDSLVMIIDCVENPKAVLYGSVHYDDALSSGLLIGMSVKNLVTPRSVLNIDTYISEFYRIRLNSIQFVDRNEKFGLAANFTADKTPLPLITLRNETGRMLSRSFSAGLSLNKRIGLNHMMSFAADYENLGLSPDFITRCGMKKLSYNYITESFEYLASSLDRKHFPRRGVVYNFYAGTSRLLSGRLRSDSLNTACTEGNDTDFSFNRFFTLQGRIRSYIPVGSKTTLTLKGDALYISNTDSISAHNNFYLLGGIQSTGRRSVPMTGFHPNQITVQKLAGFGVDADIEILRDFYLSLSTAVFAIQEMDRDSGYSLLAGYGVGLGYMSVVGPVKAGIMHGLYDREIFYRPVKGYISVGFSF
jgi:NTE family protein